MSYLERVDIALANSSSVDAFGRLRVSNPTTLFDNTFEYDLSPQLYSNSTSGSGTIAHDADLAAAVLSTGGTASGDKAVLQTKRYMRYQPGKSQEIEKTATLGAPKANVRQRIGYFDDNDGLFFEQTENDKKIVIRSSVSGSPVDTAISQADWNVDPMDGTGPSGITIDFSKDNIFHIDFQHLGAGTAAFGFSIDRKLYYCHENNPANVLEVPYMRTGNLPCRTEIENTGVAASATTLNQYCTTVISEGGVEEDVPDQFAIGRGTTALAVTTRRPVLSIRPGPTFNGITNRGHVRFNELEVLAATNNCKWELVLGGTLTGASWTAVDAAYSITQYDTAATAITGGTVKNTGWALSGLGSTPGNSAGEALLELYNDFAGTTPDILTIVCTAFTGTTNINALMRWTEQR